MGKTSISLKFVNDEFDDQQESTINASYLEKKVTLENKQSVKLAIWVYDFLYRIRQDNKSIMQLHQYTIEKH